MEESVFNRNFVEHSKDTTERDLIVHMATYSKAILYNNLFGESILSTGKFVFVWLLLL